MKRKILSIVLATVLATGILGCGNSTSPDTTKTKNEESADENTTVETDELTLSMWHIWPDGSGGTEPAMKKAIADTEEHFPGLKFDIDAVADSGDSYKTKIKTAMAGGEIPDVFFTWGSGFAESFVKAGRCLPIGEYISDDTLSKISGGTTNNFIYNDKLYGLPFSANYGLLYCNTAMFEAAGLEIPTTYRELLDVVKAFDKQGTIPICLGAKGQDSTGWFMWTLAMREAGSNYINKVLAGEETFDTPELLKAAQDFRELIDAGAFDSNAMAMSKDEAQALFLEGVYPMYYCGSWFSGDIYNSESSEKDNFTCVPFPAIEGGNGAVTEYIGGADQTFMINSEVENPEKVVEIISYLCERFSENQFVGGAGLATWQTDVEPSEVQNQILVEGYNYTKDSTAVTSWWDNALIAEKATNQLEANTKLFMGEITPEEWVELNTSIMQ